MSTVRLFAVVLLTGLGLGACTPEIGGELWCEYMDAKDKGDWTVNQAADYAKHCIFK